MQGITIRDEKSQVTDLRKFLRKFNAIIQPRLHRKNNVWMCGVLDREQQGGPLCCTGVTQCDAIYNAIGRALVYGYLQTKKPARG